MTQYLDVPPVNDMKDPLFERLERAYLVLIQRRPLLEEPIRLFRLELRFHAFLRMNINRFNATPDELAQATGLSSGEILIRASHPFVHDFYGKLTNEEYVWLEQFVKHGTSVCLHDN